MVGTAQRSVDFPLLTAKLRAVETIIGKRWIEVDTTSYDVRLHHTADQIVAEVERLLRDLFGVNAMRGLLEFTIDDNPDADTD